MEMTLSCQAFEGDIEACPDFLFHFFILKINISPHLSLLTAEKLIQKLSYFSPVRYTFSRDIDLLLYREWKAKCGALHFLDMEKTRSKWQSLGFNRLFFSTLFRLTFGQRGSNCALLLFMR